MKEAKDFAKHLEARSNQNKGILQPLISHKCPDRIILVSRKEIADKIRNNFDAKEHVFDVNPDQTPKRLQGEASVKLASLINAWHSA